MALAILRPSRVPGSPGSVAFTVDLGSNRFYQVMVGDDSVDRAQGFPVLGAPSFTSPVVGPLPDSALGRTEIEVPASRFDRDHRSVQLWSFRTRSRDAPAVSDIVRVAVASRAAVDLPPIAFSMRQDMESQSIDTRYGASATWRGTVPMEYREVRPMSGAMFLGGIVPVLSGLVSKAIPIIGGLLGRAGAAAPAAGGAAAPNGGDVAALIRSLLGGGGGGTATAAPPGTIKPETAELIAKFIAQLQQPKTAEAGGTTTATSQALAASEYSHAAVAPALLAALPALMPLLEKVLTPETIKAVLDHADPTKVIGAVTDSVKEIGKLGLDFDKQSNEHLRALNPMGVHAPVDDLLKDMGLATSLGGAAARESGEPGYRRVESVELTFASASPVMIHGRSRVCYRAGEEIAFPLDVKTPRAISDARLTLLVKEPATRKILVRKRFPIAQATTGRLAARVALGKEETAKLKAGEEYLVCAYLVWKNAHKKVIGTSRTQMITLVAEYVFDRVEEGSIVPLNDVSKYRPFWHKVWQGSFTKEQFKFDFEGKYYYVLEPEKEGNAPIATTTTFSSGDDKVKKGRLRTGMTTSLGALNALIPQISTGKSLNESQLTALRSSDFVARFNTAARFSAALSGKAGVSAAVWIYPEVKLHEVVLFKAASVDADSHVRELTEERVHFPIPVTLHVIGARTTR